MTVLGIPIPQNVSLVTGNPIQEQKEIKDTFNDSTFKQLLEMSGLEKDEIDKKIATLIQQTELLQIIMGYERKAEQKKVKSKTPIPIEDIREFNHRMILLMNKYCRTTSKLEELNYVKSLYEPYPPS